MVCKQKVCAFLLILLALLSLSCRLTSSLVDEKPTAEAITAPTQAMPEAVEATEPGGSAALPWISEIVFCKNVTDDGLCEEEATNFPSDTHVVWALFHYQDMQDGAPWDRVWEKDGEVYIDASSQTWTDGPEGWVAYSIEDENDLSGDYSLTITVNESLVKVGTFTVAQAGGNEPSGYPSFGPVTFAHDVEDDMPIGPTDQFEPGILEINAIFPFTNLSPGAAWSTEWLMDGDILVKTDRVWERENPDGVQAVSFSFTGGETLDPGTYTLNLYIDGQIVRSASAVVTAAPKEDLGPATPEEIVDPQLLQPFYIILNHPHPAVSAIGQTALEYRVPIQVGEECGEGAVACFRSVCDDKDSGIVYVSPSELSKDDVLIAASLAHELTHAIQFQAGWRCGCSVEKEFYAVAAEIDLLWYGGYEDLVNEQYGALWDSNGKIDTDLLWNVLDEVYCDCPDY